MEFLDGNAFCVLSTENRIAVINYITDSIKFDSESKSHYLSLKITVYSKIIE